MFEKLSKTNPKLIGFLSMGLYFSWILFLPFFGPALEGKAIPKQQLFIMFMITHIIGILHSAWIYNRSAFKERTVRYLERVCLALVVTLTVFFALIRNSNEAICFYTLFVILGYVSGWMITRWGAWLSSPDTRKFRGAAWGAALAGMNIILYLLMLFFFRDDTGKTYGLIASAGLVFVGGYAILSLPIQPGKTTVQRTPRICLPRTLIVFAILVFFLSGYPYRDIFPVHAQYPVYLSWFILLPYIIVGVFLGRWSDKYSHHYLAFVALLLLGIAFAISTLLQFFPNLVFAVEFFILSGNVCGNLYYWIALASSESVESAPLTFATGISFELLIFIASFIVSPYIPNSFASSQPFLGTIGIILIFVGIGILIFMNYGYNLPNFSKKEEDSDIAIAGIMLPAAATKEMIEVILIDRFNLTDREFEVIYLVIMGYSNTQIAAILYISTSTVKFHIGNALRKIGASNRHDMRKKIYEFMNE